MQDFRVVLINPQDRSVLSEYFSPCENLAIAYLAAFARRKGYRVEIIDGHAEQVSNEQVANLVLSTRAAVVGITCLARTVDDALDIAKRLKSQSHNTHVCLGGQHVTYAADEILRTHSQVDSVVRGEGEETFGQLLDRLSSGGSLEEVAGVSYRDGVGSVVRNQDRRPVANLDELPRPARDTLERLIRKGQRPVVAMLSSRGCYARCTFCNASTYYRLGGGKPWRSRSAKDVVDELAALSARYQCGEIDRIVHFYDDEFVGPGKVGKGRARAIAEEIIARGLRVKFYIFARADSFGPGDRELLALLKRAGLIRAFIGIESSQASELELFRKGTTPAQNEAIVGMLDELGISMPASGFIMFHPYSAFEALRENARFLRSIGHHSYYNLSVKLIVYEGTGMVARLREDGLLGGTIAHGGIYSYRFRDPRVGRAAEALELSEHPLLMKTDAVVRYIQATKYEVRDLMEPAAYAVSGLGEIDSVINGHFDIGYDFFNGVLSLAEGGWVPAVYESLKSRFLAELEGSLGFVERSFARSLQRVEEMLASADRGTTDSRSRRSCLIPPPQGDRVKPD